MKINNLKIKLAGSFFVLGILSAVFFAANAEAENIGIEFISPGLPGEVQAIYGPGASSLPWEWTGGHTGF